MALDYWTEFFEDLQHVRGRSRNTVLAYRRDLELFDTFQQSHKDLNLIFDFMTKKGLSTRSQARVISSVRTYYKFCESKGMSIPDISKLRPPKVKAALPKPLTLDEFKKLVDNCEVDNPPKSARNQVTLLLLFGLGCRVSELIALDLHDFNETESWIKVVGKGGKERLIPLTQNLQQELKIYIVHVRRKLVKDNTSSILINDRGKRPSRVDIWRWLSAWSERAGFSEPVSPHRFRHGCATALLESGADLRSIQMLLGHSSIQTTQIYTSVSTNKLKEEIDKHHPLSTDFSVTKKPEEVEP
ncbi:MAG: tyrosine-type recombinase/integrase [Bdellovibrionales bacterium]|nr:tyrosine-type recombinase/integrase [Bdellovibrionales bacterium]